MAAHQQALTQKPRQLPTSNLDKLVILVSVHRGARNIRTLHLVAAIGSPWAMIVRSYHAIQSYSIPLNNTDSKHINFSQQHLAFHDTRARLLSTLVLTGISSQTERDSKTYAPSTGSCTQPTIKLLGSRQLGTIGYALSIKTETSSSHSYFATPAYIDQAQ